MGKYIQSDLVVAPGASLEQASKELSEMATAENKAMGVFYNGFPLVARPGEDASVVMEQWHAYESEARANRSEA